MLGGKVHTIEDMTISWLRPVAEGPYLASLKEGIVRTRTRGQGKFEEGTDQIDPRWLRFFGDCISVGHHSDRVPAI